MKVEVTIIIDDGVQDQDQIQDHVHDQGQDQGHDHTQDQYLQGMYSLIRHEEDKEKKMQEDTEGTEATDDHRFEFTYN